MGHGAHQFAILDDGASAHPLHDPPGQGEELRVRHLHYQTFIAVGGDIRLDYLDVVFFEF